jgi:hypothetical protein
LASLPPPQATSINATSWLARMTADRAAGLRMNETSELLVSSSAQSISHA